MSSIMDSACGASAFTRANPSPVGRSMEVAPNHSGLNDDVVHTWDSIIDDLLRIRQLDDDWDGEGSEAPPRALVDGSITLVLDLNNCGVKPADRVVAGVNGTIYFEWHSSLGYQEIEVTSPLDAEIRWLEKGSSKPVVQHLVRVS